MNPKDVIIACDFPSAEETLNFLKTFSSLKRKPFLKIGMELFYAEGAPLVRKLKAEGYSIFLDLKLHDIPNTVRSAMAVLSGLGVDMVNVHAAGGSAMMKAAIEGLSCGMQKAADAAMEDPAANSGDSVKGISRPKLIAVTQLTSTSSEMLRNELLINESMPDTIMSYAANAAECGLDGVVCSPLEAAAVHSRCGNGFLTVTPGVRFAEGEKGDQKRVMTPAQARIEGSDYIVVGRPITRAADPLAAYARCMAEFLNETIE